MITDRPDGGETAPHADVTLARVRDDTKVRADPAPAEIAGDMTHVRTARGPATSLFGEGYGLRGRYLLDRLIGQGAIGQVWRAKDLLGEEARDRNPFVAIKVLNSDFEGQSDAFVAMHREAARAQKLAHPNVVTVHTFDRDDVSGRAFIVMELLEGRPLDRVIGELGSGGMTRKQALPIIRGMAEGLAYAHRKGIVHCDFKPANVFLVAGGTPKILDFGIARAASTTAGQAGGPGTVPDDPDDAGFQGYTPGYAAPEVLSGQPASPAEDVFALGLVAFELLTGTHPFRRMSALDAQKEGVERPPLRGLKRREVRAIESALAFDPAQRPENASVFLRRFNGIPAVQKALLAAVATLLLAAAGLAYHGYLQSLPAVPLTSLPLVVQRQFHDKIREGNASLAYLRSSGDITASADAAEYFAEAYQLHPRDPDAVRGLEMAATYAIGWYSRLPDRGEALRQLQLFRAKSTFYAGYAPLQRAIHAAGGRE
jgi:serine/threonine protein kinase